MAMIPSDTSNKVLVLSETEESAATEALSTLHAIFANAWPNGKALGDKVLTPDTIRTVNDRVIKSLSFMATERKREAEKQIRADLADLMGPYAEEYETRRAEYNGLSAGLRASLGGFPGSYNVPCSALSEAFESGMAIEQVAIRCKELGFVVTRLADASKTLCVKVTPPAAK
jgi:hypothetical protein